MPERRRFTYNPCLLRPRHVCLSKAENRLTKGTAKTHDNFQNFVHKSITHLSIVAYRKKFLEVKYIVALSKRGEKMKITVKMVARELGKTSETIRKLIDDGDLPIAIVKQNGKKKDYVILPNRLYEATGIKFNGSEPLPTVDINIDYEKLAKSVAEEIAKEMAKGITVTF